MDVKNIPILSVAEALGIEVNDKEFCRCLQNEDKNPSMRLNSAKNLWKCFSCGEGGSNIDLVMHAREVEVNEAINWLNETFAGRLPNAAPHIQKPEPSPAPDMDFSEVYQLVIDMGEMPPVAIDYLTKNRGIRKELVIAWGIKYYSPEIRRKVETALKAKYKTGDAGGLLPWSKKSEGPYYIFSNSSYIFPFWSKGLIFHLQGRSEKEGEGAKYLNLVGRRADCPYGLNALEGIAEGSVVYLVEGLFDTLTLNSVGLTAIGIPGAGLFTNKYKEILSSFKVRFISQNDPRRTPDKPTAAEALERKVRELLPEARIFHIPDQHKDLNNWHVVMPGGLTKEILVQNLVEIKPTNPENETTKEKNTTGPEQEKFRTASEMASDLITSLKSSLDKAQVEGKERADKNLVRIGIEKIDEMLIGGLREGIYGCAGSPGTGKTSAILSLIKSAVSITNRKVILFTLEMSPLELLAILLSWGCDIPKLSILDDSVSKGELSKIADVVNYNDFLDNLFLVDNVRNIAAISQYVDQFCKTFDGLPPLVIIDYLQIIQPVPGETTREERLLQKKNIYELKKMSSLYHMPIIVISSVPRDYYRYAKNGSKLDPLASFKEAGDIEFALSGGFYLEHVLGEDPGPGKKALRLYMVKHRWGRCYDNEGEYIHFDFNLNFLTGEITPTDFVKPTKERSQSEREFIV